MVTIGESANHIMPTTEAPAAGVWYAYYFYFSRHNRVGMALSAAGC
jgi:hypothetical protein